MSLLTLDAVSSSYGPVPALRQVSLSVDEGEAVAVVGPNGAGKSTLTLAIAGVIRSNSGEIVFAGNSIRGLAPEAVARKGVALVPEGRHIFEGLTVKENLLLGTTARPRDASQADALAEVYELFPILAERRSGLATKLSGGEQQQLAIARALLSRPRLLIIDEPSLGLSPVMIDRVYEVLAALKAKGVTLLLVEQNVARIADVADRVVILASGVVQRFGAAHDVLAAKDLNAAYLGAPLAGPTP